MRLLKLILLLILLYGLFGCAPQTEKAPPNNPPPLAITENLSQTKLALDNSKALGYLGEQYEKAQRYDEAVTLTRRAIFNAQQANALAWLIRWQWQLGRIFQAQRKTNQAIPAYQQAVQLLVPEDTFRWEMTGCQASGDFSFYEKLRPLFFELADLLLQRAATEKNPTKKQRDLQQVRDTIEQLKTADIENYYGDCVAAFQQKKQRVDNIDDPHAAVIYPILLDERLELLVSFPRKDSPPPIQRVAVPVGRDKIRDTVLLFHKELQAGRDDWESTRYLIHAQQLYKWLIAPLHPRLPENIHTLVFVPEGVLGTIPMAALHDGEKFLIENYAVAITPSLNLTAPKSGSLKPDNTYALLSGLTEETQAYPKLPYAEYEIQEISKLYSDSKRLLNEQFTLAKLTQALNNDDYNLVHIISHAEFAENPEDSFIVTYGDQKLSLKDLESIIKPTQRRETPIELLTLSACNTAKGKYEQWAALGLSGIAVKAGARSALATLWKAHDTAAYHLVRNFYNTLKTEQNSKAQALQAAQIALIDTDFYHPFYWAPLVLIGNWL
ncbi:MAG: hypothetical protein DRR19_20705 [Candidatus Parabeggiatoa sp. nov. 1]|nr:MAG: hypothetical protein DRR19_20705 [Gammaproteobacteria bacterium]